MKNLFKKKFFVFLLLLALSMHVYLKIPLTVAEMSEVAPISQTLPEQNSLQIEGEWFGIGLYTNMDCHSAELDENGCFHVLQKVSYNSQTNEMVFYPQGDMTYAITEVYSRITGETITEQKVENKHYEYKKLSDNAVLYYLLDGDKLSGVIFIKCDSWRMYYVSGAQRLIFFNGRVIPYDGKNTAEYLMSGSQMFLVKDNSYTRGTIRQFGSNAFIYDITVDPNTYEGDDYTNVFGTPFYLFISTSI